MSKWKVWTEIEEVDEHGEPVGESECNPDEVGTFDTYDEAAEFRADLHADGEKTTALEAVANLARDLRADWDEDNVTLHERIDYLVAKADAALPKARRE